MNFKSKLSLNDVQINIQSILNLLAVFILVEYFYSSIFFKNMDVDGVCYAIISRNLSEGLGTIWQPIYSFTQHNPFYEHPSLGLWFESLLFKCLGDHAYTERIFALVIALINFLFMYLFWRKLYKKNRRAIFSQFWVIVVCFFSVPYFIYYYIANGLEMQANVFAIPAIYILFLVAECKHKILKVILMSFIASSLIFISILINGPLTLFPLIFYFIHWLVYKGFKFSYYLFLTVILFIELIIIAICFFEIFPGAYLNFNMYVEQQVLSSLIGDRHDSTSFGFESFKIIFDLLSQFKYLYIYSLILVLIIYFKNKYLFSKFFIKSIFDSKEIRLCIYIAISATLPIIVSSKQRIHYSLQGGLFLFIIFLLIIYPAVSYLFKSNNFTFKLTYKKSVILNLSCIFLAFFFHYIITIKANSLHNQLVEKISPTSNITYLYDANKIGEIIPNKSIVSCPDINNYTNPNPVGNHLMRKFKISINPQIGLPYLLLLKDKFLKKSSHRSLLIYSKLYEYQKLPVKLKYFYLYKKI